MCVFKLSKSQTAASVSQKKEGKPKTKKDENPISPRANCKIERFEIAHKKLMRKFDADVERRALLKWKRFQQEHKRDSSNRDNNDDNELVVRGATQVLLKIYHIQTMTTDTILTKNAIQ